MDPYAPTAFHVNPSFGVPIYRQLVDQVRAKVAGGRMKSGRFLPSVRQVADTLQINAMTVSKAYTLLEREGVLVRVRGQGMMVASPRVSGSVGQRQRQLRPLLEAVIRRSRELNLTDAQIQTELRAVAKRMQSQGTDDSDA